MSKEDQEKYSEIACQVDKDLESRATAIKEVSESAIANLIYKTINGYGYEAFVSEAKDVKVVFAKNRGTMRLNFFGHSFCKIVEPFFLKENRQAKTSEEQKQGWMFRACCFSKSRCHSQEKEERIELLPSDSSNGNESRQDDNK